MNKLMTVGMAAVLAAGVANAEDIVMTGQAPSSSGGGAQATAELALVSSHVWRGQVQNNDFVWQPQVTVSEYGISFNVWANYNMNPGYTGVQSDISEIDLSLAYTLPLNLNDVSFDVGFISYQFPANSDAQGESTAEVFASAHWLTFQDYVIPSVTYYGDIKSAKGSYILFDIAAPYQISDYLWVEVGAYTGWGNTSYNDYYFGHESVNGGNQDKGWNDYNLYGTASYEIMERLTASLNLTYTGLYGGSIKNGGKAIYEAAEKFWGGVNVAYDF